MGDAPEVMWRETIKPNKMYPNGGSFYYEKHNPSTVDTVPYRRADLPPTPAQIMADPRIKALVSALEEARRAIGDHFAPSECYATGPLTGDHYRDMVECPACAFIERHDAALSALEPKT